MAIRFKPPGVGFGRNVKYIYFGMGSTTSSAVIRRRVGMVMFKDPQTGTVYYPYRLSVPIHNDIEFGSINKTEYVYGRGELAVKITPNTGYQLPLEVSGDGCDGNYHAYPDSGYGIYTIRAMNPGVEAITLSGTCNNYSLTVEVVDGSSNAPAKIAGRGNTVITITPNSGFFPPSTSDIVVNGALRSKSYVVEGGVGKLTLSTPSEDIYVRATCRSGVYASAEATNGVVSINGGQSAPSVNNVLVQRGSTVVVQFSPDVGRTFPDDITITGTYETSSYLSTTGRCEIYNVTGAVYVNGACPEIVKLTAPSISVIGDMLTIINNDENTTSFDLYVNGTYKTNIPRTT